MRIILSAILLVLAQNVGAQTDIVGCTVPSACNYNPEATINDPGSCDFVSCQIEGCLVPIACNYNPEATISAPCDFILVKVVRMSVRAIMTMRPASKMVPASTISCDALIGCTVSVACNYDPCAVTNDGSCDFFSCIVFGCNNPSACNFDPEATFNDGSCDFVSCVAQGCTIEEACNYDPEALLDNGTCEFSSCAGCTNECAPNYDATATIDNGSCDAVLGCTNADACNYDACADQDDSSCEFVSCVVVGCMDEAACNFDPEANYPSGLCDIPEEGCEICVDGASQGIDANANGIGDCDEVEGCTDSMASNYNPYANVEDGSCEYPTEGCTNPLACNFNPLAALDDGSCEYETCAGCHHRACVQLRPTATISDNEYCFYPEQYYNCGGECINDADGDGICDELEVLGCQDETACNYDPEATDAGYCAFPCSLSTAMETPCAPCSLRSLRTFLQTPAMCQAPTMRWWLPLYSPFAPAFLRTYNNNECYDDRHGRRHGLCG